MTAQEELDEIYISIGSGTTVTDDMLDKIKELEDIISPPLEIVELTHEQLCNDPHCWDCAAIRGGDPMDA